MLCSFPVQMMWSFCDDSFLLFTNDLQTAGKSLRNVSPSGKEFILVNIDFSIDTDTWHDNAVFFLQFMERCRHFWGTTYLRHLLE